MNRRLTLVLTALLLLVLAGTALAEAFDFSGRWQDPNDDKAMLSIMRIQEADTTSEQPRYDVRLIRTDSADAGSVWAMSATCDPGTDTHVYTEGAKRSVTFGEDGGIASEETLWDDSEGTFTSVEGALQWTDSRDGELFGGFRFVPPRPPEPPPRTLAEAIERFRRHAYRRKGESLRLYGVRTVADAGGGTEWLFTCESFRSTPLLS